MTVDYRTGDALELMRAMPEGSVDLSACSPPFLALRNYNDLAGQWGSEANPAAFLDNLLTLASETRRVLSPFGSLAWELGDTYSGSGSSGWERDSGEYRRENRSTASANGQLEQFRDLSVGWPLAKSLTGIPTLFAWSLAYGRNLLNPAHTFEPWRVRNIIVWSRNNPPVGALGDKYRPACSYITVATVAKDRWFDLDAVRTDYSTNTHPRTPKGVATAERVGKSADRDGNYNTMDEQHLGNGAGAPPLDHWHDTETLDWLVNGQPSKLAHYAMWPPKLAERLILSMCPLEVCRTCTQPRRRITERTPEYAKACAAVGDFKQGNRHTGLNGTVQPVGADRIEAAENVTVGWSDCGHDNYRPGLVLDPFAGTGTTLAVAEIHGRDAIGFDLDPDNHDLYPARLAECRRALYGTQVEIPGTLSLFDEATT